MKTNKEIQVHILPTERESNIVLSTTNKNIYHVSSPKSNSELMGATNQHLYFTSDEKPKVGDWCVYFGTDIMKHDNNEVWDKDKCRKIIGTTDTKLKLGICEDCKQDKDYRHFFIKCTCSLPQPSQAFIEKYCKIGGIDEVLVEYEYNEDSLAIYHEEINHRGHSDINLEDDISLKVNSQNEITIHPIKTSWGREEHLKDIKEYLNTLKKEELEELTNIFDNHKTLITSRVLSFDEWRKEKGYLKYIISNSFIKDDIMISYNKLQIKYRAYHKTFKR